LMLTALSGMIELLIPLLATFVSHLIRLNLRSD